MLLDDLRTYLLTGSLCSTAIYCGRLPMVPDTAIGLFEEGGLASVHTMSTGPGAAIAVQPRVRVVIRDAQYESARDIMDRTHHYLDGVRDQAVGTKTYFWIVALGQPEAMGVDENDRHLVGCRYQVICT